MCRVEPNVTSVYPPASKDEGFAHERVALRAFSKWLDRGCPEGDSDADWFGALSELAHEDTLKASQPPVLEGAKSAPGALNLRNRGQRRLAKAFSESLVVLR